MANIEKIRVGETDYNIRVPNGSSLSLSSLTVTGNLTCSGTANLSVVTCKNGLNITTTANASQAYNIQQHSPSIPYLHVFKHSVFLPTFFRNLDEGTLSVSLYASENHTTYASMQNNTGTGFFYPLSSFHEFENYCTNRILLFDNNPTPNSFDFTPLFSMSTIQGTLSSAYTIKLALKDFTTTSTVSNVISNCSEILNFLTFEPGTTNRSFLIDTSTTLEIRDRSLGGITEFKPEALPATLIPISTSISDINIEDAFLQIVCFNGTDPDPTYNISYPVKLEYILTPLLSVEQVPYTRHRVYLITQIKFPEIFEAPNLVTPDVP